MLNLDGNWDLVRNAHKQPLKVVGIFFGVQCLFQKHSEHGEGVCQHRFCLNSRLRFFKFIKILQRQQQWQTLVGRGLSPHSWGVPWDPHPCPPRSASHASADFGQCGLQEAPGGFSALFSVTSPRLRTHPSLFSPRKLHSGMKTYGCELCGKRFLDSLRLRMHLLAHSGGLGGVLGWGWGVALSVHPGLLWLPRSHVSSAADTCGAGCTLPRAARCKLVLQCPVI